MPPPIESRYFTEQKACCHSLAVPLAATMTAIENNTAGAVQVKISLQNSIHEKAQTKDIVAPKSKVFGRQLGKTEWSVYYCQSTTANTQMVLMVGKQVETGGVFPFFDWVISPDDQTALNGDWDPGDLTNDVDLAHTGQLIYDHKDKHFNPNLKSEAQYTIGTTQNRKSIVAGMEAMAVEHGFGSGERFFWFNSVVGKDPLNNTHCIRVDTPGGPSQHSHPIPEAGAGEVNHDGKVVAMICYHTREREFDELVALAKYLKLIGAKKKAFPNLKKNKHLCGGLMPPPCAYWAW